MTKSLDNEKRKQVNLQFQFRCAPDLLKWIEKQAKKDGRTRSNWIEQALWRMMVLTDPECLEKKQELLREEMGYTDREIQAFQVLIESAKLRE